MGAGHGDQVRDEDKADDESQADVNVIKRRSNKLQSDDARETDDNGDPGFKIRQEPR